MSKDDGKSKPTKDDDVQISINSDQRKVVIKPTVDRKKPKP